MQVKAAASAKHLQTLADVREKHASDMEVRGDGMATVTVIIGFGR